MEHRCETCAEQGRLVWYCPEHEGRDIFAERAQENYSRRMNYLREQVRAARKEANR